MCIKTDTSYCHGCEFNCTFGAQRKLLSFTAKYQPTINSRAIPGNENHTEPTRNAAIQFAQQIALKCVRYQK